LNRIRKNTIIYTIAAAMLFSGNFAFAVSHIECSMDEAAHHKCKKECCQESDCCAENTGNLAGIEAVFSDDICCEVHVEQAVEQDYAVLIFVKTFDNVKHDGLKTESGIQPAFKPVKIITHKPETVNIYLSVSNLRI
jgi:hypothetical protein